MGDSLSRKRNGVHLFYNPLMLSSSPREPVGDDRISLNDQMIWILSARTHTFGLERLVPLLGISLYPVGEARFKGGLTW